MYPDYPPEIKKSQMVRLWDVFGLGPAMVYIGVTNKIPVYQQILLITAGMATVWYNGRNYLKNAQAYKKS